MKLGYAALKRGSDGVREALAAARSARNRATRAARAADRDAASTLRHHKRRLARENPERELAMKRRVRVQVPEADRPGGFERTPRKLFSRRAAIACAPLYAPVTARADGLRSVHYSFTSRGLASTRGRRWRAGEAERAMLYTIRDDALEGSEAGWWSNVAADRNEVVAFARTLEEVERHDRANASVYVVEVIALDSTMTARQRRQVVKRLCADLERRGLPYVVGIHLPDPSSDQRNYHVHLVTSLRPAERVGPYDWSFGVSKVADFSTSEGIRVRRELVASAMNATLTAMGSRRRYTALSNKARELADAPQPKLGQGATWVWRRLVDAEQRRAALDQLRDAATAIREGLDLADAVAELGRTAATRLAAGRERVGRISTDAPATLGTPVTLVRRRLAYAALSIASTTRDLSHRVDWLSRVAAERRRQRARLLALRDEVAEWVAGTPSLGAEKDHGRAALAQRAEWIVAATHRTNRLVTHLGQTVQERHRHQDRLRDMSKAVADMVAAVPSLALHASHVSDCLRDRLHRLASSVTEASRDTATLANICGDRLQLASDRPVETVEQTARPTIPPVGSSSMPMVRPARRVRVPRQDDDAGATAMAGSVAPVTTSTVAAAAPAPPRSRPGQDIGRLLIERERASRAMAEAVAPAPANVPDATQAPNLMRRIGSLFAKRSETPQNVIPADHSVPKDPMPSRPIVDTARSSTKPIYAVPTGGDPTRAEAIRLAAEAINAAGAVPMRQSGSATTQLEIVIDALPAGSPLRTAAMLEDDPLIQMALRQRHGALVAAVERHLAFNPAENRATLLRQLRHADPATAGAAALLFSDDEIAAMSVRVAVAGRRVTVVKAAVTHGAPVSSGSGPIAPTPVMVDGPARSASLVAIARLFHSDDWDPRDYGRDTEPPARAGERARPEAVPLAIDVDQLAWLQHQRDQRSR